MATLPSGGEHWYYTAVSQLLLLQQLLPGRHDVLVDLLDLKRTDTHGFATFESVNSASESD